LGWEGQLSQVGWAPSVRLSARCNQGGHDQDSDEDTRDQAQNELQQPRQSRGGPSDDSAQPIARSAVGDGQGDLVEDGVNLGRNRFYSGANHPPLPLRLLPISRQLLKLLSLAVDQQIEPLDVAGQLRHHSAQLSIMKHGPGGDAFETVKRGHLSPA
jgi:hypothetical protein